MCFRNALNTDDYCFVFGCTTFKTTVDRKEAVAQNRHSFYNQAIQRWHDVTTVPLSYEEAHFYNELFASHLVTTELSPDYDAIPVLISDITSEVSNRLDELVRLKFTWWFDDYASWIDTIKDNDIFNFNYIDTFM